MNRILTAARLHTIAPGFSLILPWAIVASSFAINVLIWGIADIAEQTGGGAGGLPSLYITLSIVYVQSMASLLPVCDGVEPDPPDVLPRYGAVRSPAVPRVRTRALWAAVGRTRYRWVGCVGLPFF